MRAWTSKAGVEDFTDEVRSDISRCPRKIGHHENLLFVNGPDTRKKLRPWNNAQDDVCNSKLERPGLILWRNSSF
jgi:hypothetical protein